MMLAPFGDPAYTDAQTQRILGDRLLLLGNRTRYDISTNRWKAVHNLVLVTMYVGRETRSEGGITSYVIHRRQLSRLGLVLGR